MLREANVDRQLCEGQGRPAAEGAIDARYRSCTPRWLQLPWRPSLLTHCYTERARETRREGCAAPNVRSSVIACRRQGTPRHTDTLRGPPRNTLPSSATHSAESSNFATPRPRASGSCGYVRIPRSSLFLWMSGAVIPVTLWPSEAVGGTR